MGVWGRVGVRGGHYSLFYLPFVSALLVHEVGCGQNTFDHVLEPAIHRREEQIERYQHQK